MTKSFYDKVIQNGYNELYGPCSVCNNREFALSHFGPLHKVQTSRVKILVIIVELYLIVIDCMNYNPQCASVNTKKYLESYP